VGAIAIFVVLVAACSSHAKPKVIGEPGTTTTPTTRAVATSCLKGDQTVQLRALTRAEAPEGVTPNVDKVTITASDRSWATTHVPAVGQVSPRLFLWWCKNGAWRLVTQGPLDIDCNVPLKARNELGIVCTTP
jgi:hypothetical protein